jgi:hypothetical protein
MRYQRTEAAASGMNERTLDKITTGWISVVISWIAGFFLMIPLAIVFDAMSWPFFNGWALAHGSFILAWPLLSIAAVRGLRSFRK